MFKSGGPQPRQKHTEKPDDSPEIDLCTLGSNLLASHRGRRGGSAARIPGKSPIFNPERAPPKSIRRGAAPKVGNGGTLEQTGLWLKEHAPLPRARSTRAERPETARLASGGANKHLREQAPPRPGRFGGPRGRTCSNYSDAQPGAQRTSLGASTLQRRDVCSQKATGAALLSLCVRHQPSGSEAWLHRGKTQPFCRT